MEGGSHVTDINGGQFFHPKPNILYINRTALKARTKFCMVIHRFFSAVRKILSKMCGHVTQFWRHRFFFSEKIGQFQSLIKIDWQIVLKKLNTLYNTTTQGLFNAFVEKFTAGVPTAWRHFEKVSLSKKKPKTPKTGT